MKIKNLIKNLSKLDPELNVVLSSDAEGNSFEECDSFYISDDSEYFDREDKCFIDKEEIEEFNKARYVKCVIFFPY